MCTSLVYPEDENTRTFSVRGWEGQKETKCKERERKVDRRHKHRDKETDR